MAKRIENITTLRSFDEVDDALREVGTITVEIHRAEANLNERIEDIRKQFDESTKAIIERKILLEKNLEQFCKLNRDEFEPTKTRELTFGTVSFRLSPPRLAPLHGFTWAAVLHILKKMKLVEFIRTREDVDRDAIKAAQLSAAKLAAYGLGERQDENFYYEVNWTKIGV